MMGSAEAADIVYDQEFMPLLLSLLIAAQSLTNVAVPQGALLRVRLDNSVGSFASRPGSAVRATLIAPLTVDGETAFASGSVVSGTVVAVQRVGLGILHETSSVTIQFSSITSVDGVTARVPARVTAVDTGREEVLASGSIREVRRTASVGNRAAHLIRSVVLSDIHAQAVTLVVKSLLLQVSEPEIYLPAGTELTLALTETIMAQKVLPNADSPRLLSDDERESLAPLVAELPTRTETPVKDRPSDLVNLVFVGSREEISAAFRAAGWTEARKSTARANVAGAFAFLTGHGDMDAPMSKLMINDAPSDMAWQKGSNDLSKRHHIRLWKQEASWDGEEIWIGAATRDIDYAYFRPGRLISHKVARLVDRERDKIMDDLADTNCAEATDWWERPEVPHFVRNATGDAMETDSRLGFVRLNACENPRPFATADFLPVHGTIWQLMLRRQILSARSDLIRHNIYWRGYEGVRYLVTAVRRKPDVDPDAPLRDSMTTRLPVSALNSFVSLR
jgi:LssY C-terminus